MTNTSRDPFWAQKDTENNNRDEILRLLYERSLTFTELRKKIGLSKPVLSKHLKSLRQDRKIEKDLENEKVVYRLSKGAYTLPPIQQLRFEIATYLSIQTELTMDREAYVQRSASTYPDEDTLEELVYVELKPESISAITSVEIVQAVDKWLTPIILYSILSELKTGKDFTKAACGLIQRITQLFKRKGDLVRFEDILRQKYSDRLTERYVSIPSKQITIIEMLDKVLENMKFHEEMAAKEEREWRLQKEMRKK